MGIGGNVQEVFPGTYRQLQHQTISFTSLESRRYRWSSEESYRHSWPERQPLKILGIGSGPGDKDVLILPTIGEYFTSKKGKKPAL